MTFSKRQNYSKRPNEWLQYRKNEEPKEVTGEPEWDFNSHYPVSKRTSRETKSGEYRDLIFKIKKI